MPTTCSQTLEAPPNMLLIILLPYQREGDYKVTPNMLLTFLIKREDDKVAANALLLSPQESICVILFHHTLQSLIFFHHEEGYLYANSIREYNESVSV
jgi:hypothetical protein